jgi:alkylation response protein AidB-like acyl-CoA dehydrogenase
VRRFAAEEVAPHSARIDREAEYPREAYRRIADRDERHSNTRKEKLAWKRRCRVWSP